MLFINKEDIKENKFSVLINKVVTIIVNNQTVTIVPNPVIFVRGDGTKVTHNNNGQHFISQFQTQRINISLTGPK